MSLQKILMKEINIISNTYQFKLIILLISKLKIMTIMDGHSLKSMTTVELQ